MDKTCLNRPVFWTGTGPQSAWRADKDEREKRRRNDTTDCHCVSHAVSGTFSHSGTYLCGDDSLTISPSLYHADTFSLGVLHSVLTATRSQLYTRSTGNSRTHGAVTAPAIEMTARAAVRHNHGKIRVSEPATGAGAREREGEKENWETTCSARKERARGAETGRGAGRVNAAEIHSPVVRGITFQTLQVHQPTTSFLHPVSFSNTVPVGWSMVAARSNCAHCVRDVASVLCAGRGHATLAVTHCAPSVSSLS